jgi:hypothetical protein
MGGSRRFDDASCGAAAMKIGETVTYEGRSYVLLGMQPMGVPDRRLDLEDAETGEVVSISCSLLVQSSRGFGEEA